jgi:hypothetical protein
MTQIRFNASSLSPLRGHRGFTTLAGVASALFLAGCGSDGGKSTEGGRLSKVAYEQRIQRDGQKIEEVLTPLSRPPSSLTELAREIETGQERLREAADDLDRATPPKDVAHDNDLLVADLRTLADELEPLRKGAATADAKLVRKALANLEASKALKEAQRATNDMKKKGYRIGALAR